MSLEQEEKSKQEPISNKNLHISENRFYAGVTIMKKFRLFSRSQRAVVRQSSPLNHPRYHGQRGASAIEYAIILAVITVVIIGVLQTESFTAGISGLATDIGTLFSTDD